MADTPENKENKKSFWANAFAVEKTEDFKPNENELELLDRLAKKIAGRGLSTPSILFLESARPLNFIGAQTMAFFEPLVRTVFASWEGYSVFYKLMEKRGSVECLIDRIEYFENEKLEAVAQAKAKAKEEKGNK